MRQSRASVSAGLAKEGVKFQKAERIGPDSKVEGPISLDTFVSSAFFKDTEGNLLMLWQRGEMQDEIGIGPWPRELYP